MYTKKRNRLKSNCLNNLVFVQSNGNLINKHKKDKSIERLLASDASIAGDWIVDNVENDELESELDWQVISDVVGVDEALGPQEVAN